MSTPATPAQLDSPQAILDEINALLESPGAIDEVRAKNVRKAVDTLRGNADTPEPAEDADDDRQPLDAEIDTRLKKLSTRIHKQVERRNRDYKAALDLLDEMEAALKQKALQQAEQAEKRLVSLLATIPGLSEQRWQDIETRRQRALPQLRELESWRHWGTRQAREELIGQIRLLAGSELHPEEIAKTIHAARNQWHAWDKTGDRAGKELWNAFDQACKTAYQPCVAHFARLKAERAENLRKRRALIDTLNERFEATDWKQPDWRQIDRFTRQARRDFYSIGTVDFRHRKPLEKALNEVLEKYEKHLGRERTRSYRSREKLVADIEALRDTENLRDALNQLESLKKQWEITVVESRRLENRLWKRFQAACDNTYQRRDAERKAQSAEHGENLQQKQALIEELAQVAQAGDEEVLGAAAGLARLRERWQAIGRVPPRDEKGVDKRWREVQQQFRKAFNAAESRAASAALDNLARRADLCHQWEQSVLAGSPPDRAAVTAEWEALPALPADMHAAISRRFSQALTRPDEAALAGNLAGKQAACLRLEVILELDSPQECQAERMAYQVERLNAALQKDPDAQDSPADLLLRALSTGAVPAGAAEAIEQRIQACFRHYRNRTQGRFHIAEPTTGADT